MTTEPKWRDMEIAPRDGTVIILHDSNIGDTVGYFSLRWRDYKGRLISSPVKWMPHPLYQGKKWYELKRAGVFV